MSFLEKLLPHRDQGASFLASVIQGDSVEVMSLLKSNPKLVWSKGNGGITCLHAAAYSGRTILVEILLTVKPDVNARDEMGDTPLHYAAANDSGAAADLLLKHGAVVNARDDNGETPLKRARALGYSSVAAVLRYHGGHE